MGDVVDACELCGRIEVALTRHHSIPRLRQKNRKVKKHMSAEDKTSRMLLCGPCHDKIHSVFTERQLERDYNNIEALRRHPEIVKFIRWVSGKSYDIEIPSKRSKKRRN